MANDRHAGPAYQYDGRYFSLPDSATRRVSGALVSSQSVPSNLRPVTPAQTSALRTIPIGDRMASIAAQIPDYESMSLKAKSRVKFIGWLLGLLSLACIGFGFFPTFKVLWWIATAPIAHPHGTWILIRVLCSTGFLFLLFGTIGKWLSQPSGEPSVARAYVEQAITPFRESSPFGDAALAERHQIQAALMGHGQGFSPQFED